MNVERASAPMEISATIPAEEWNRFLESVPDSHHLQTTYWAELKSLAHWEADRLAVVQADRIVAGLQLLHRHVARVGRVGYVPRGPVFASGQEHLSRPLLQALWELAGKRRLRYLTVQPPRGCADFVRELPGHGFTATPFQVAPTATVLIDLQQPPEALRARMNSSCRRALRKAEASGLRVRSGSAADLPAFHALLIASAKRHGFTPRGLEYYERMWRVFAATNDIVLFLAELDGETVAGELDVAFGDTLVSKRAGWSGKHPKLHPNELVVWTAMNWAREQGLKFYDMEGFDPGLARKVVSGAAVTAADKLTHHWSKLGFGGQVVLLPDNYEIVRLPVVGALHRVVWGRWLSLGLKRELLRRAGLL